MRIEKSTSLSNSQKGTVIQIWNSEYPVQLMYQSLNDFDKYLDELIDQHHYLLISEATKTPGWAMTFMRDNERWFAIIVSGKEQKKGLGKLLLDALKEDHDELNGWVIDHNKYVKEDGSIYHSPTSFYTKNGFRLKPDSSIDNDKISAVKVCWTKDGTA